MAKIQILEQIVTTPYKQPGEGGNTLLHPSLQFLSFIAISIGVLIIGNVIGAGLVIMIYGLKTLLAISTLNVDTPNFVSALWILQFTGTTLPILAAPVFFAFVIVRDPGDYIKPSFRFPWVLMLLVLVMMFAATPLIELLSNINQKMVLPSFLKWMRDSEDQAQKITAVMLQMDTVWQLIYNVLFIGLLTAVVEEFMFRGCLQTIFVRWTKNYHMAVWVTAILFSAFHMEFFGFLPRLLLGALFGYMVVWSSSIWPAVWAHFINNSTDVLLTYLYQHKHSKISPDDNHVFNYTAYAISFIIILFLFWVYKKVAHFKKPALQ